MEKSDSDIEKQNKVICSHAHVHICIIIGRTWIITNAQSFECSCNDQDWANTVWYRAQIEQINMIKVMFGFIPYHIQSHFLS